MAAEHGTDPPASIRRHHHAGEEILWVAAAPVTRGGERYVASWGGVDLEVQGDLTGPWPLRAPWIWSVSVRSPGPDPSAAEGLADGLEEAKAAAEGFARACLLSEDASALPS
jgi:hypothetical protein